MTMQHIRRLMQGIEVALIGMTARLVACAEVILMRREWDVDGDSFPQRRERDSHTRET
jgi:hypothetical protein